MTCLDNVELMQWGQLSVFNLECMIVCALLRGCRGDDGRVYCVTPPCEGRSGQFTQEFGSFAAALMPEIPVKRPGHILGDCDTRMWRMRLAHLEASYERLSFDNVMWMGADAVNRRKRHNYLTVFVDLVAKRGLFTKPGKNALVWAAFAAELLRHNGHP